MRAWVRRPFDSWTEFFEYLTFLSVSAAGVANASWLWIAIGAMVLLLLSWSRYRELFAKAAEIDREWRDLAWLMRAYKAGHGLDLHARAWKLPFVVGVKVGHDALFLAGAFIFGHVTRWAWF
jgi:hypothetical protein